MQHLNRLLVAFVNRHQPGFSGCKPDSTVGVHARFDGIRQHVQSGPFGRMRSIRQLSFAMISNVQLVFSMTMLYSWPEKLLRRKFHSISTLSGQTRLSGQRQGHSWADCIQDLTIIVSSLYSFHCSACYLLEGILAVMVRMHMGLIAKGVW